MVVVRAVVSLCCRSDEDEYSQVGAGGGSSSKHACMQAIHRIITTSKLQIKLTLQLRKSSYKKPTYTSSIFPDDSTFSSHFFGTIGEISLHSPGTGPPGKESLSKISLSGL